MSTTPKQINLPASINQRRNLRSQVLLGNLPDDFLRFEPTADQATQILNDEQAALALQHQQYFTGLAAGNIRGRLDVTVTEAKLVKNYGVTRMDPYLRIRIGHHIYETKTCYNGAKNPRWNKVFHCFLPNGVDSLHIEIFDECAFSADEKIAWALYTIPNNVFDGETVEEFVPLNGKQGTGREGVVGIVMSFTPLPATSAMFTAPVAYVNPSSTLVMPQAAGIVCGVGSPVYVQTAPNHVNCGETDRPTIEIKEEDVKSFQEMFPSVDVEVIRTLLESNRGNKDRTVNALLELSNEP